VISCRLKFEIGL